MRDVRRAPATDASGNAAEMDRATIRHLASKLPWRVAPRTNDDGDLDFEFDGVSRDSEGVGGVPAEDIVLDGSPPASSPGPTVFGGPGYLAVKWTAISNHDPVTYEVHVSESTGFVPDAGTFVGEVSGTMFFIRKLPTNAALEYGTAYYVKIVAKDGDGSAAPSTEDVDQLVEVNSDDIAVDAILANHIAALQIDAQHLAAELILASKIATAASGARNELDGDGYRSYASDGTTELVNIPSDGSDPFFQGVLYAMGMQIAAASSGADNDDNKIGWVNSTGDMAAFVKGYGDGDIAEVKISVEENFAGPSAEVVAAADGASNRGEVTAVARNGLIGGSQRTNEVLITDEDGVSSFIYQLVSGALPGVGGASTMGFEVVTVSPVTVPAVTANNNTAWDVTVGSAYNGFYSIPIMLSNLGSAVTITRLASQLVSGGSARVSLRNTSGTNAASIAGATIVFLMIGYPVDAA